MADRPLHRDPGPGGGLPATHRPRGPCAVFTDAARRRVRILGVDLPERAESVARCPRHGFGRVVDHPAAVGSNAGPQNPRPSAFGNAVLCGGTRMAPRAVWPDDADTGRPGRAP